MVPSDLLRLKAHMVSIRFPLGFSGPERSAQSRGRSTASALLGLLLVTGLLLLAACGGGGGGSANNGGGGGDGGGGGGNEPTVNQQPGLSGAPVHVVALAQAQQDFTLTPVDAEGDSFTVSFKGCAKPWGTIRLKKTDGNLIDLDCTVIYAAGNTPQLLSDVALPIQGYFTSGPVDNSADGVAYNTLYLVLDDDASPLAPADTPVVFDVKIVNIAPVILIQGAGTNEFFTTRTADADFSPALVIIDQDFLDRDFYQMSVAITLDNTQVPGAVLNTAALQGLASSTSSSCTSAPVITATQFSATCPLSAINTMINSLAVIGPGVGGAGGSVQLSVTANDNGYAGQCDVPELSNAPCPLTDSTRIYIDFTPVN
jgi:hypothetical protein